MAGDYTRFTFNPLHDYAGVMMQQGRVQLDADFNELIEILDRRLRAETTDIIGRCIVPKQTPDGFRIALSGGVMTIGRGRVYADGILAENHGTPPLAFDSALGEMRGTQSVRYDQQPYLPPPPALPTTGTHLVYLDVWRREVTALEDSDLVEKAVGVDTAARLQTIWQVKIHSDNRINSNISCDTPDDQVPGWLDVISPPAGRLTTSASGQPGSDDPCIIAPNGGFRGTENRLYRVEVHDGSASGAATFKWSRDNASIATTVTAIDTQRTQLTVARTGRDSVLRFNPGDWVEVTDDARELAGLAGEMRKVQSVDDVNRTITLTAALTSALFPTSSDDNTNPNRHTRVLRWDQKGLVRNPSGTVVGDVDANGGVIPITIPGTFVLEDGAQVTFSLDPAGGRFKVGDYWVFAARTADASVEQLHEAPPRGIHHHYCRLAFVTFPNTVIDCRHLWPPDAGESCDCTVCVSPESHNSGTLTIQRAIDQVSSSGGKVCLETGVYNLNETLNITGRSVCLQGHGLQTELIYTGPGPAIMIERSIDVTAQQLTLTTVIVPSATGAISFGTVSSIVLQQCFLTRIQNCLINFNSTAFLTQAPITTGIEFRGTVFQTTIRENRINTDVGIQIIGSQFGTVNRLVDIPVPEPLAIFELYIEDNIITCNRLGFFASGMIFLFGEIRISGNTVSFCPEACISVSGFVSNFLASHIDINGNTIDASGVGIRIGTTHTRIKDNDIAANVSTVPAVSTAPTVSTVSPFEPDGILLANEIVSPLAIDQCQIIGNRINGFAGNGISSRSSLISAMIKQNTIENIRGGGIVMQDGSGAQNITIENNHIRNVGSQDGRDREAVGIRLFQASQADISNNRIVGVGQTSLPNKSRDGILVMLSTSVRIVDNEVLNIGTDPFINIGTGIRVLGPFHNVEVINNQIRRNNDIMLGPANSAWFALFIFGSQQTDTPVGVVTNPGQVFLAVKTGASTLAVIGTELIILPNLGAENVAVRGNLFEGHRVSNGALVVCRILGDLGLPGSMVFGENRCLLVNDEVETAGLRVVEITAGAIIASSNYVQAPQRTVGMEIFPMVAVSKTGRAPFTVLGNISSGEIKVNNAVLDPPWAQLNVVAS